MESQVDRAVGVQADMDVKPEDAAVQEGHDSFDTYKAAGKVSHPVSMERGGNADCCSSSGRRPSSLGVIRVLDELPPSCSPWRVPT